MLEYTTTAIRLLPNAHIDLFGNDCLIITVTPHPGGRARIRFVVVASGDPTIGKLEVPSDLIVKYTLP